MDALKISRIFEIPVKQVILDDITSWWGIRFRI